MAKSEIYFLNACLLQHYRELSVQRGCGLHPKIFKAEKHFAEINLGAEIVIRFILVFNYGSQY
jgi:hypothetical protein